METIMLEADYLVIGAGAQGMAFTDELIHNTTDTTIIVVDNHSKPGGHWNDAYDFVTLHQPALYYGVNSKHLGKGGTDLASSFEILAYHEDVMKDLVSTGRVQFFFQCEYTGNGRFRSLISEGYEYEVIVRKKTVDATYTGPTVPSTNKPKYKVSDGVHLQPINGLSRIQSPWKRYVIIGGGKTGIDAVLYLINQSVNADRITWVVPNDFWLMNRKALFFDEYYTMIIELMECIVKSKNCNELYRQSEKVNFFMRLDPHVEPRRNKAGTVTPTELEKLRLVENVVRKGRVRCIEQDRIIFENGEEIETDEHTLHVDCSASGCQVYTPRNIWKGDNIVLQDIKMVQSCYSASVIAAVECLHPDDEQKKNELLKTIMHPQTPSSFIDGMVKDMQNEKSIVNTLGFTWLRNKRLSVWYHVSRLDVIRFILYFVYNEAKIIESLNRLASSDTDT